MKSQILSALKPVRLRQRLQSALIFGVLGMFCSGVLSSLLGFGRLITLDSFTTEAVVALLAAGPVLGLVVGFFWKTSWKSAATAVDDHYELKDRTLTALQFADEAQNSEFHQLQVKDATAHLGSVHAKEVVPFRTPRHFGWAAATLLVAGGLLLWPVTNTELQANTSQPIGIQMAADEIAEDIEQLEEFAQEQEDEELNDLLEELKEQIKELRDPETDVREALATISEMQEKLAQQAAQYNDAEMDAQLNALGDAMAAVEAFKAASAKLQAGEFDQAAQDLQNMEDLKMERRESRAAGEKLAEVAAAMKRNGLGKMSDSVDGLAKHVKAQRNANACKDCEKIGKQVKNHALAKKMNQLLKNKLKKLGEAKAMCKKAGNCAKCGGNCKGGQCNSQNVNLAKGQAKTSSNSPSKSAGAKSAGNTDGKKTQLEANRQMEQIAGQLSESGDSDYETSSSTEGQETAQRKAREAFAKYKKMSEAVLDSEPIPLGHRQTIRRYFELIRPSAADDVFEDENEEAMNFEEEE